MKIDAAWLSAPEIGILAKAFSAAGFELRFVGGCVRDSIIGRAVHEVDATTPATPEEMMALLEKAGLRGIPTGIEHGTITVLVNDRQFEITTLRKDIKTDGRHAEVIFTRDWAEDAQRRDFTMNALYVDKEGTLYDYVGGLEDCKARRVLFIGDAAARIREDYLRILRYFRFVAQLGKGQFDAAAIAACSANKEGIARLSGERVAMELLKLLAADEAYSALKQMEDHGILAACLLVSNISSKGVAALDALRSAALVKLACLVGDVSHIKAVAERLRLSNKQTQSLQLWLSHIHEVNSSMSTLAQQKLVRQLGAEDYLHTLRLAAALHGVNWKRYAPYEGMANWQPPAFPVSAYDLLERGHKEGKALGEALRKLENIWEEGGYTKNREELLTLLR